MKKLKQKTNPFSSYSKLQKQWRALIVVASFALIGGIIALIASLAANASLSLVPSNSNVNLGSNFTVTVHENSGTQTVSTVQADLTYPANLLQFVSIDTSTSHFDLSAEKTGSNGIIRIGSGATIAQTGDQIVAIITFKAIGQGSANVSFASTSAIVDSVNYANILDVSNGASYVVADTTAPTTPTNLIKTTFTATSISLSWTASTDNVGVTGYKIFRNGSQVGTNTTTTYQDTGLAPGTTYSYRIAAYDAASNTSAQSTSTSFSTTADTTAPTAPTGLTLVSSTMTSIGLSWTASTDNVGVASYRIYRNGTQVGSSTATNFTDSGLVPGKSYAYTVTAVDTSNNASVASATSSFSTTADTVAPTVPTGLTSAGQTGTSISLSWTASTDNVGVTGYKIFRNGSQVGTNTTSTFTDNGLTPETTYTYTVSAYDASSNNSAQSSSITATTTIKAGDINGDNKIDYLDLAILASDYHKTGQSRAQGNLNGDPAGNVDAFDFAILASNWGK